MCIRDRHVTYIDKEFECDRFFPNIDKYKYLKIEENEHDTKSDNIKYKVYDRIY